VTQKTRVDEVRRTFLATAFVATALVIVPTGGAAEANTACSQLEIQAHRGYHYGSIDQNTIPAFDQANAHGYAIETDAWHDAQGQLWVFHDRDVSRATNGTGKIDQMTTAQVRALRYNKGGSPLPTFQEAVAAWSKYPTRRIYLEPKQKDAIPGIVQALRGAGLVSNIRFTGYWDYVENNFPEFGTEPKSPSIYFDPSHWVQRHADAVMTKWQTMTLSRVAAYHQAGLEVLETHNNTTTGWTNAIKLNFDGIMTDRPNEAKAFCPTVQ
jgi:glycerophosphoryl diester phosphodiesterase